MTAFELIVGMVERGYSIHVTKLRAEDRVYGVMLTVEYKLGRSTLGSTLVDNRLIVPEQSCKADMDALYADMLRQMEESIHQRYQRGIEERKNRKIPQ